MSEAERIARVWFEQVWNQKDATAIDRMFTRGGKAYGFPNGDSALGFDEFKESHRVFCGAFPDLKLEILDIVADGDRAAIRWKVGMTHKGDHLGIPATGKQTAMHGSSFIVVGEGKILDGWNHMDFEGMMKELSAS